MGHGSRVTMTDTELLLWLAENGTEISQAELEENYPRVLAAIERKEAEAEIYHGWFGESWGAPINEIQPHITTPVDEDCIFCQEPICETDQGYVMPFNDESEGTKRVAAHKRCQHRALGIEISPPGYIGPKGILATAAERRPANYDELSEKERWAIDKDLGILDWDGSPET